MKLSNRFFLLLGVVLCTAAVSLGQPTTNIAPAIPQTNCTGGSGSCVNPLTIFEVGDGNSVPNVVLSGQPNPNCDWDTYNGRTTEPAGNATNTPTATCAGAGASEVAYGYLAGAPG